MAKWYSLVIILVERHDKLTAKQLAIVVCNFLLFTILHSTVVLLEISRFDNEACGSIGECSSFSLAATCIFRGGRDVREVEAREGIEYRRSCGSFQLGCSSRQQNV